MTKFPPPFTRVLPTSPLAFGSADYVAVRFDTPDVRGPLALTGLERIATFAGDWAWCRSDELLAKILAQPTESATAPTAGTEAMRSSVRTAMNRIDAAKDLLDGAFEDLTDALLGDRG